MAAWKILEKISLFDNAGSLRAGIVCILTILYSEYKLGNHSDMMISGLLLSAFLVSQDPDSGNSTKAQVPPVMYEFMGQFYRLQPLMFSTKTFADPK
jgi:hypothetical protein